MDTVIDARFHDAVIFEIESLFGPEAGTPGEDGVPESVLSFVRRLHDAGIRMAGFCVRRGCETVIKSVGLDHLIPASIIVDSDPSASEQRGEHPDETHSAAREAARRLGVAPERSVVVALHAGGGRIPARDGGFALVIEVDWTYTGDHTAEPGPETVVGDLTEVVVRNGDKHMSELPNALDSYGQLIGVFSTREPVVFLDFDGTLSEIVDDPGAATLIDGAAEALTTLATLCPVAVLSGRDLADVRERIGVPGLWYAGSHGFEMVAPDGSFHQHDAAAAAIPVLERAAEELRSECGDVPGVLVEHKRFGVALHYRNVAPGRVGKLIAAVQRAGKRHGLRVTGGRKVIELRPDVDWDKGTALTWVRDRIGDGKRLLPVYIGDDLTDEDAFEAVRSGGLGIVVRSDEDNDRKTAAQFTVADPRQVCEFLRRGAAWLDYFQHTSAEAWEFSYTDYDPPSEKLREALCTVGNGYFATRGAAPESTAGQVHYPGTYAAGVFNRLDDVVDGQHTAHESLVNLPNWLPLTFRIGDGEWFNIDDVEILSYRQTLDLKGAVLTRDVRFRDAAGRTTSLVQQRFVAMDQAHVAALETRITAEDWSGGIQIRSMLDGDVRNTLVERYRALASNHLCDLKKRELNENSVILTMRTTQSDIPVALAARTTVWHEDAPAEANYRLVDEEWAIGHDIFTDLAEGQSVRVEKVVTLVTGRDVATSEAETGAQRRLSRQPCFADIRAAHMLSWGHLWERLSIEFDGHPDELRILRLHLLHLAQTVSYHYEDLDAGVPARGLHGEAYRGHIFWDELFIFPVLNLRLPLVTRSLLRYRYRRLLEARMAAKLAGYDGAMFPWQSGSDGREESPSIHLNPRSHRWNPDASHLAHHIGLAVAYNAWQFYQVTGDHAYLIDYGAEMLVEIARFWVSRTTYDEDSDRYRILGVIGPDEFHSGYPDRPFDGVDNNAYTNVMAVWVILRAMEALQLLPLRNRLDIREKLGVTDAELAKWDHVSRRMFVPFHDGVISQFEGYEKLADLDWDAYREKYGNMQRLDRILEAEDDDVNRYKASKQADALMLLYLLSDEELREILARLGYRFRADQVPKMVDYYEARTSHGSTLSAVVHSWVLARANRDRALEFFQHVLKSDVDDIQGGTTAEGVHLAAMAGSVDLMQRCFTGLETRGDRLILDPNWPEELGILAFPIHYRGMHLHLRVSGKGAIVSMEPRGTRGVEVECRGQRKELTPGNIVRFS
ncbi:trehalose-phosphatase [Mycolicibacterium palauense]|uniref:trehalose-phosphatase n=1 Tax=Mycolicibacterium palauense TaxID=2034511 RepID=UPI000BFEF155|nr:trehalose-phosphatase [Mycolicibacterium palauense]